MIWSAGAGQRAVEQQHSAVQSNKQEQQTNRGEQTTTKNKNSEIRPTTTKIYKGTPCLRFNHRDCCHFNNTGIAIMVLPKTTRRLLLLLVVTLLIPLGEPKLHAPPQGRSNVLVQRIIRLQMTIASVSASQNVYHLLPRIKNSWGAAGDQTGEGNPGSGGTPRSQCAIITGGDKTVAVSTVSTEVNGFATCSDRGGQCRNINIDYNSWTGCHDWGFWHYCNSAVTGCSEPIGTCNMAGPGIYCFGAILACDDIQIDNSYDGIYKGINDSGNKVNSVAVNCKTGYTRTGNNPMTCDATGTWSTAFCRPICPTSQYRVDGTSDCAGMTTTTCGPGQGYSSSSALDQSLFTGSTANDATCTACEAGKFKLSMGANSCRYVL